MGRRDTKAELTLRRELHRRGLRYRVDVPAIPALRRRADVVFSRERVAVFCDGCFWHGCPDHGTWPTQNAAWWREKIETNIRRDADTNLRLEEEGWLVSNRATADDASKAPARPDPLESGRGLSKVPAKGNLFLSD